MTLIVENGNQIPNANSFVTDAEYQAYAIRKGLTVADTEWEREIQLFNAIDYITSKESCMQGYRVSSTQALLFPRTGVLLHGWVFSSNAIPSELKNAQMEAAASGLALLTNTTNNNAKREKVDVLEVEYNGSGKKETVNAQRVNVFLNPLMMDSNKLVRT